MTQWAESVVRARFLVASLGEDASPPWWRSQATSPVGRRFLDRLFPRTVLAASLDVASQAAAIEHDARLGRLGAYHLFRLPIADDAAIYDVIHAPAVGDLLGELTAIAGREERLAALVDLAAKNPPSSGQGPVFCGNAVSLRQGPVLGQICAAYLQGFRSDRPVYPYFHESDS